MRSGKTWFSLSFAATHPSYEYMRMEGAVSATLSPHPLLVDIYGFCALSMFNEAMMNGNMEDHATPYVPLMRLNGSNVCLCVCYS